MREELKDFAWYIYGLRVEDLDYTLRMVKDMINARKELLEQEKAKVWEKYNEDAANEIISDIAHYAWVDNQYLWHFCLWRLQGIFEQILVQDFLTADEDGPKPILGGLKRIISAVRRLGYSISEAELEEIRDWAKLRNALSHQPPEMYYPVSIDENDILEYIELLKKVLGDLYLQK